MKIVFFGSSDFGLPCLDALVGSSHRLLAVFTQPARHSGRGKKVTPTAVAAWAAQNNIPCTEASNINTRDMVQKVKNCNADLLVVIAFGQKISNEVINITPKGAINVHGSLLPNWRGAGPINAAVLNGDEIAGITIITVADKMDAGLMIAEASCELTEDDTAGSLHKKLAELSPPALLKAIDQIQAGTAVYTEQDASKVTFAPKIKKADGYIDWSESAEKIKNKIRGYWPWPGAQTDYYSAKTGKCYRVKISKARVIDNPEHTGQYGMLDKNLNVICGKNRLEILELKPAGKGLMSYKAFANGRGLKAGDIFMPIEKAKVL